jgi:hypothetical protein
MHQHERLAVTAGVVRPEFAAFDRNDQIHARDCGTAARPVPRAGAAGRGGYPAR